MPPTDTALLNGREATLADHASPCLVALGADLTAYLAGADSVAQLSAWLAGTDHPAGAKAARRLATAGEVIRIFAADNRVAMAGPWLREVARNGCRAPAEIIRADTRDDGQAKGVVQAAMYWVAEAEPSVSGTR